MYHKEIHTKNGADVVFLNKKAMKSFIRWNKNQKQMGLITGSVLSVLALVALSNSHLVQKNEALVAQIQSQDQVRSIASVGSVSNDAYTKAAQAKLLQDLEQSMRNKPTILAQAPTKAEIFLMGDLGGSYRLEQDGTITSLVFHQGAKYKVDHPNAFAVRLYDSLYARDFSAIRNISSENRAKVFELISADGSVSQIEILLDEKSHLNEVKIY